MTSEAASSVIGTNGGLTPTLFLGVLVRLVAIVLMISIGNAINSWDYGHCKGAVKRQLFTRGGQLRVYSLKRASGRPLWTNLFAGNLAQSIHQL